MFVDVCFPNNNEKEFILIAKKLKTDALIFVYDKPSKVISKDTIKTFSAMQESGGYLNKFKILGKKCVFYYDYRTSKNFHAPLKTVNQVLIKDIKRHNNVVALPFYQILKYKQIEEQKFIMKLCQKYDVKLCIASFAHYPKELRSKYDLLSIARSLGMNTKNVKKSISSLYKFITT